MEATKPPEALEKFLSDVEKHNGQPVVVGPWGFKKVRFGGKLYLMAMTKAEMEDLKAGKGPELADLEGIIDPGRPPPGAYCTSTGFATCVSHNCQNCQMYQGNGYYCYCP